VSRLLANMGARADSDFFDLFDGYKGNAKVDLPNKTWLGVADSQAKGRDEKFWQTDFKPDNNWRNVNIGESFNGQFKDLKKFTGLFWYRLEFDAPANIDTMQSDIYIGAVDDESWTWLNDKFLGEVTNQTNPNNHWEFKRQYQLKEGVLKSGKNVLTVLCNNTSGAGGLVGVPRVIIRTKYSFYTDTPISSDDPYRYYRW